MHPNLDGPNFGFAHRLGQDAKADATRSEGLRPPKRLPSAALSDRAEGEGGNECSETARAGRNGGEAISDRSRMLPPGQHRYNALQEIRRFRARITALHRRHLRPPHGGLKAKGK